MGKQKKKQEQQTVDLHRVQHGDSVCSFPGMNQPVRFDDEGNATVTAADWEWIAPYATAHAIERVG